MKKINIYLLAILFIGWACTSKKADSTEESQESADAIEEKVPSGETAQSWISEDDMDVLSNTWVDDSDRGELSNTWTEDAYAEELNSTGELANSWVDESGETVFRKADIAPDFIGGREALFNYFKENIVYPDDVEAGTVYVAFIVGSDGSIRDTRVFKGVKESMDKEALRLINDMPNWDPGVIDGQPVASVYGLPIIFRP